MDKINNEDDNSTVRLKVSKLLTNFFDKHDDNDNQNNNNIKDAGDTNQQQQYSIPNHLCNLSMFKHRQTFRFRTNRGRSSNS